MAFYGGYFIFRTTDLQITLGLLGCVIIAKFSQFIVSPQRALRYQQQFTKKSNYSAQSAQSPLGAFR